MKFEFNPQQKLLLDRIAVGFHVKRRNQFTIQGQVFHTLDMFPLVQAEAFLSFEPGMLNKLHERKSVQILYDQNQHDRPMLSGYEFSRLMIKKKILSTLESCNLKIFFNIGEDELNAMVDLKIVSTDPENGCIKRESLMQVASYIIPTQGSTHHKYIQEMVAKCNVSKDHQGNGTESSFPSLEERLGEYLLSDEIMLRTPKDYVTILDGPLPDLDAKKVRCRIKDAKNKHRWARPRQTIYLNSTDVDRLLLVKAYQQSGESSFQAITRLVNIDETEFKRRLALAGLEQIKYSNSDVNPLGTLDIMVMDSVHLEEAATKSRPLIETHGPFVTYETWEKILGRAPDKREFKEAVEGYRINKVEIRGVAKYSLFKLVHAFGSQLSQDATSSLKLE